MNAGILCFLVTFKGMNGLVDSSKSGICRNVMKVFDFFVKKMFLSLISVLRTYGIDTK